MRDMTALEPDDLGRVGYIAYGNVTGWQNYQGLPMPEWEELAGNTQQAWAEAAVAIVAAANANGD